MIFIDLDKIIWNCVWNFVVICILDDIFGFYVMLLLLFGFFFFKEILVKISIIWCKDVYV